MCDLQFWNSISNVGMRKPGLNPSKLRLFMRFEFGNTTFGLTVRLLESDEGPADEFIPSRAQWMSETHSLNNEDGKLRTLEY